MRLASGSATLRVLAVAAISGALMIPLGLEWIVLVDRQQNRGEAEENIARSWASSQEVAGPVILLPVAPSGDDPDQPLTQVLRITPKTWKATIDATHEIRSRGIHSVPLLTSSIRLEGRFEDLGTSVVRHRFDSLNWQGAVISLQVSDTRGIQAFEASLGGSGMPLEFVAGIGLDGAAPGIHAPIALQRNDAELSFVINLQIRSSDRLRVVPMGEDSEITMKGTWPHPKFDGRHLPDARTVASDGFEAHWKVHSLARGFPSQLQIRDFTKADSVLWTISPDSEGGSSAGFSLHDPLDPYRWVERSFKYGILLVVLTLTTVLCLELILSVRLHLVQYAVVGVSQVFFFLLLLALSEHIGFGLGFLAGSVVLTGMTSAFVLAATKNGLATGVLAGAIAVLYAALFLVLRQETYALLTGSLLLLAMLATVMWATRNLERNPAD